jgi:hypothetical protein
MRYDYPDRSASSSRCSDYSIGRNIALPAQVPAVWVEIYVKFQQGFTTVAPTDWGCTSNPDLKLLFLRVYGQTGRFGLNVGNSPSKKFLVTAPPDEPDFLMPMTNFPLFTDGNWHRLRFHGSVLNGGRMKFWVDDTLMGDWSSAQGLNVTASSIYAIALGRNMNQGPGMALSMWWGKVSVWNVNPGW